MANEDLRVRISAQVQGLDQVESLKNAVRQLQTTAAPASADLQRLKQAAMDLGGASGRTENDLRRSINALKDVRAQLSITGAEYRKLTGTIDQYQRQLDKATGAQQRGGKAMQFAQTAGAVAASGVFGGPEGLIGAGLGAVLGAGAPGALAGGAIGAQVGAIRQQLSGTATFAADLEKQRIALRLVLKDTAEYNSALGFLSKTSKDYAIPQDQLIRGFTQLAASVKGAGGNVDDTKTAFQGVAAGIRGTGGSLEDLNGALLATSQVFSKGKVTAEELRGQIGERLPGAFTLFAQSIGKTPQELDKALEKGEVSLADFLTFSKTVFGEYGENAKIIADSPAAAGDRLQTNLKNLSETVGKLLQPVGAAFQDTFSEILKYIDAAAKRLADFFGLNASNVQKIGELNNLIITQQKAIQRERDKLASGVTTKEAAEYNIREFEGRIAKLKGELGVLKALEKASQQQQQSGLPGNNGKTDLDTKALEKAEREREKTRQEAIRNQTELNRLLQEELALNYQAGNIGQGVLERLDAELDLLKQLTRYRIEEAQLTSTNEKIRKQKIININTEFQAEEARVEQERKRALQDIAELGAEADALIAKFGQKSTKTESPLTVELQAIDNLIKDSVISADQLLEKLEALGGTKPATIGARVKLGDFKTDAEATTPEQRLSLASSNLLSGEVGGLEAQIAELSRFGAELSTLDTLKQKYLADWDKLDPVLKGQLETLAGIVDQLLQANEIANSITTSIGSGLTNAFNLLVEGTDNWGDSLRQIAATVLKDIAKELLRILVIEQLVAAVRGVLKGLFPNLSIAPNANGNAFAQNGIVPYAMGGIVDKPTLFKFANGGAMRTGVMGEAGPEAIIPLKRGRDGKLGVSGGGGGAPVTVNVSVDATGSQVQGNAGQGDALGRAVAQAVQAEMIKQRRPGGLLAA